MSAPDRREYYRWYYLTFRKGQRVGSWPRSPTGRPPKIDVVMYDTLKAWKRTPYRHREPVEALAEKMGLTVEYVEHVTKKGIKRYDAERYREFVSLIGACVDEARASE